MQKIILSLLMFVAMSLPSQSFSMDFLGGVEFTMFPSWEKIKVADCNTKSVEVNDVKMQVFKGPVYVETIILWFSNDTSENFTVNSYFTPGYESNWVDLGKEIRCLKEIHIRGRAYDQRYPMSTLQFFGQGTEK